MYLISQTFCNTQEQHKFGSIISSCPLQVSGFAFAGYAAGIATYLAVNNLHISLPTTLAEIPFLSGS